MVYIDRVVGPVETKLTMSAQVICLNNHLNLSNPSQIPCVAENDGPELDSTDNSSTSALYGLPDSGKGRNLIHMKKMSSLKRIPSVKKPNRDTSINTKVVWDDCASIASLSVRSTTEKTTRFDNSRKCDGRRSSWLSQSSDSGNSKVIRSLRKYDEDLQDIILNQRHDIDDPILAVNRNDIKKIKLLGKGQFCSVHSVAGSLQQVQQDEYGNDKEESRKRMIYAYKAVDMQRVAGDDDLIIAASDLAIEAKVLSELDHKNIIKLRGLCCDTFSRSFHNSRKGQSTLSFASLKRIASFRTVESSGDLGGYFLLLDVLTEVLSDRLAKERRIRERNKDMSKTKTLRKQSETKEEIYARIRHVTMGIVEGMQYLHSHDIVLRDLKPGNVGFDDSTNVRLFDFGMARRVSECQANEICGSPRYMAPEIMQGEGYTLKVDVYSFGIMLYELCTLEVPFASAFNQMKTKQKKKASFLSSIKSCFKAKAGPSAVDNADSKRGDSSPANLLLEFYRRVACDELRPANNNLNEAIPCPKLVTLIKECWSPDPNERPSFDEIATRLTAIFNST